MNSGLVRALMMPVRDGMLAVNGEPEHAFEQCVDGLSVLISWRTLANFCVYPATLPFLGRRTSLGESHFCHFSNVNIANRSIDVVLHKLEPQLWNAMVARTAVVSFGSDVLSV